MMTTTIVVMTAMTITMIAMVMRRVVEEALTNTLMLARATFRTRFWKTSKESPSFSAFRRIGSARAQTFSWGFKSGEYLGQSFIVVMLNSPRAAFAFDKAEIVKAATVAKLQH